MFEEWMLLSIVCVILIVTTTATTALPSCKYLSLYSLRDLTKSVDILFYVYEIVYIHYIRLFGCPQMFTEHSLKLSPSQLTFFINL